MGSRTEPATSPSGTLCARRELLLFGGALGFGLLVVPLLIWIVGHWTLGPYTHGDSGPGYGPGTLFADYFSGLFRGNSGYWTVALGPIALLGALRLWRVLMRRLPRN